LTLGTTTTELDKLQFADYLDRIVDHAALHWDCHPAAGSVVANTRRSMARTTGREGTAMPQPDRYPAIVDELTTEARILNAAAALQDGRTHHARSQRSWPIC
jgi:hypothetical protein